MINTLLFYKFNKNGNIKKNKKPNKVWQKDPFRKTLFLLKKNHLIIFYVIKIVSSRINN